MSNSQWFYADAQQQQLGPITFEQIQQLAANGQILPTTLIWNEGMPNWTAANQVQGVFNSQAAAVDLSAQGNPYAAPNVGNLAASPVEGSYPIPHVKRCNFALYLSLLVLGLVMYGAGAVMLLASISESAQSLDAIPAIETQEDLDRFTESQNESLDQMSTSPSPVSMALLGLGMLVLLAAGILGLIYLYRAWFILQPGGARTTPGKAVGFMFIPLFNLYWMFVNYGGWSPNWNRIRNSHANLAHMPPSSDRLFLAGPICMIASIIPIVGLIATPAYLIIFMMMTHKMCKVVNAMADAQQAQN